MARKDKSMILDIKIQCLWIKNGLIDTIQLEMQVTIGKIKLKLSNKMKRERKW